VGWLAAAGAVLPGHWAEEAEEEAQPQGQFENFPALHIPQVQSLPLELHMHMCLSCLRVLLVPLQALLQLLLQELLALLQELLQLLQEQLQVLLQELQLQELLQALL